MSVRVEGSPRGIGRTTATAVGSRPMTPGAPRSFGGERPMTNFAKYMNNSDRAVPMHEAHSIFSAPKVSPMPVHVDRAVRSFDMAKSKVLTPNMQTALMVRPERRMKQPVRTVHFTEPKVRQAELTNKTVTFSDLTYAKTFPFGNKEMFFNTKTETKGQTLFQKSLTPKMEKLAIVPTIKEKLPEQTKSIAPVVITTEMRKQADREVDQMMLRQVKEQLKTLIAVPQEATEAAQDAAEIQTKPEISSKKALALLAKVTTAEENEKKSPVSQEKISIFHKAMLGLFQKVDMEKQQKKEKKDKKKFPKVIQFMQDKKTMDNRESTINEAITKLAQKNLKKGETMVDGQEIARLIPVKPSLISRVKFQIMHAILPELITDGSLDAIQTNIAQLGKVAVHTALEAARKFIRRFPAIEMVKATIKRISTVSSEDVKRVFMHDKLPVAA